MSDKKTYDESVADAAAKRAEVSAARKAGAAGVEPDPESSLGPDAYALEAAEAALKKDEAEAEAEVSEE